MPFACTLRRHRPVPGAGDTFPFVPGLLHPALGRGRRQAPRQDSFGTERTVVAKPVRTSLAPHGAGSKRATICGARYYGWRPMRIRCGTSGFSYKEWKGSFYPRDLPASKMLAYYAERLQTVEINNTFYRMPRPAMVEGWRSRVPSDFRFVIKASRRITHMARLKDCSEAVQWLLSGIAPLGEQLGLVLFQLPPNLKRDVPLLSDFLTLLPSSCRPAFEFRNATWFDDGVYEALRAHPAALVGGDQDDEAQSPPFVPTAPFGYLRLRRSDYLETQLGAWAERIRETRWDEAYAFFKHEQRGPQFAGQLHRLTVGDSPAV